MGTNLIYVTIFMIDPQWIFLFQPPGKRKTASPNRIQGLSQLLILGMVIPPWIANGYVSPLDDQPVTQGTNVSWDPKSAESQPRSFLRIPTRGARKYNKKQKFWPRIHYWNKKTVSFFDASAFFPAKQSHPQKSPPKLAFGPQTKVFRLDFIRHIWATKKIWRNILGGKTSKHLQTSWTIGWGSGVLGGSSQEKRSFGRGSHNTGYGDLPWLWTTYVTSDQNVPGAVGKFH